MKEHLHSDSYLLRWWELRSSRNIMLLSLGFGLFFWVIDSVLDYLIFYVGSGTFLELLITKPPSHELYFRLLIILCFLAFGRFVAINFSKRKQVEKKLREQKYFSEKIVNTSNAIIVGLDKNHKIVLFNEGAEKITGYKHKDVLGKDWFEIFFSPETLDEMNKVWKASWGLKAHSYINPIRIKDGEEKFISWQTTGIYDEANEKNHILISIGEDITERVRAERALYESEEKFKILVTSAEEIVYMIDRDGTFRLSEGKGLSKLGLKAGEVVGRSVFDLYKEYPEMLDQMRETFNGETKSNENQIGDIFFKNWYTPHENKEGEIIGLLGLSVNITEQKEAEKIIQDYQKNLEQKVSDRTRELEAKNKELERFNSLFVGREFRIKELRDEVKELKKRLDDK